MRKQIIAANWKMNKTALEVEAFLKSFIKSNSLKKLSEQVQVILAVPYIFLSKTQKTCEKISYLHVAAQNCHQEYSGAFTGEISAKQLQSIGISFVIIGHSERRQYFAETDEIVLAKVKKAIEYGLTPIVCCGEPLAQRESGDYAPYILAQLTNSIFNLTKEEFSKIIIAYEPIWAIGTGKTATSDQAQEIHALIRKAVADKFGIQIAEELSILYGGSCNPQNAQSLFSQKDVDGGLIGGASLQVDSFEAIINEI